MLRASALALGSLLFLAGSPARAVPGFADFSDRFAVPVDACTAKVRQVVQSVVGAPPGNLIGDFGTAATVTPGFVPDTGVLVECISNPSLVCGVPSSTLFIFAFSEAGSARAIAIRQQILAAFGNPQSVDCGVGRNPVNN